MIVAWLLAALGPRQAYPILPVNGEQGSAKTTTTRLLRSLIDPNRVPWRSMPKDERDLMIAAMRNHVLCFDYISRLPGWFSDALCRLSTGGGLATRALYSDADEIAFEATCPSLLNGIGEYINAADLLDRSISVELPRIGREQRRTEQELKSLTEELVPEILGGLLDVVAAGQEPAAYAAIATNANGQLRPMGLRLRAITRVDFRCVPRGVELNQGQGHYLASGVGFRTDPPGLAGSRWLVG